MLYFIVRVFVYVLAILLTLWLLPGVHVDMRQFTDVPMAEVRAELAADPDITPEQEQLVLTVVGAVQVVGPLLLILGLAFAFWFWNWLLWPVVLFFTGRVVLWSFGLLLIAGNALLFYVAVVNGSDGIVVDSPALLWCALGGMSMAFWLFFLEGVTGLDSPLHSRSQSRRRYWQTLNKLTFGGRNYFAENLRIAQSLDIITMYLKDIAFDNSPFGPIRRFFQHIIYWFKKPLIGESTPETVRYMLQELGPTYVKLGQIVSSRAEQLPPNGASRWLSCRVTSRRFP